MAKLKGFSIPDKDLSVMTEIEKIRWREHKSESAIIVDALKEYIDRHKDGNSTFTLDHWQSDINFKARPAIGAKINTIRAYYKQLSKTEYQGLDTDLNNWLEIHDSEYDNFKSS